CLAGCCRDVSGCAFGSFQYDELSAVMGISDQVLNALTISIAGIPVTLEYDGMDATTRLKLQDTYAAFVSDEQEPRLRVQVEVQPGAPFINFTHPTWQIRTRNVNGKVEFESHLEAGWADLERGTARLVMRPDGAPENFLRVLYAWLCLENQALLVHASGVIRDGQGYVFFGPSGSGKTTVAHLSRDATVLSDDLVIIRKWNDAFWVHGVPFRGDLLEAPRTNASAPLAGLFTLVKDT